MQRNGQPQRNKQRTICFRRPRAESLGPSLPPHRESHSMRCRLRVHRRASTDRVCCSRGMGNPRQQHRKIQCRARLLQRHHHKTCHLLRTIQVVWRSFDTAFCKSRRCLHQATLPGTDHTALRLRRGVLPRHFHNTWHNRHRNRRRDTTRVFRPTVVSASKMEFGALYQGGRDWKRCRRL